MDPVEFRLNNAVTEGSRKVEGPVFQKIGLVECLEAARNHEHYRTPLEGPNRGRGIASGFWMNRGFHSSVNMTVNPDGTVNLIEGSVDIGGSRASIAQQAAETLGIAYEDIKPQVVDTDSIGYTMVTGGSRTTFATGWAAILAAEDVKGQMVERAASIWDVPADDVEYDSGVIRHKIGRTEFSPSKTWHASSTPPAEASPEPRASTRSARAIPSACTWWTLRLTRKPGKPKSCAIRRSRMPARRCIPATWKGRSRGARCRGIGWALNEEYYFSDNGQMMNSSFLDYRMPTSLDLPMIDTVIVEVANPGHPYWRSRGGRGAHSSPAGGRCQTRWAMPPTSG